MTNPNEPITTVCSEVLGQTIYQGLSIREHMAIEFTKAMVSFGGTMNGHDVETTVRRGIAIADELIKQLNNEK